MIDFCYAVQTRTSIVYTAHCILAKHLNIFKIHSAKIPVKISGHLEKPMANGRAASVIFSQEDILSMCIQIFENFLPAISVPDDLAPGVSSRMVRISEIQHFSDFLRNFAQFCPFQTFRNIWSSRKYL